MSEFAEFASRLLLRGSVVFRQPPGPVRGLVADAVPALLAAFEADLLDLAGPAVAFDPALACEAGEVVRQACWALVSRDDRADDLEPRLRMGRAPRSPSDHASADLFLRFLPRVYRRARSASPADPVVGMLARVLRGWPLSGVAAGLDEGPLGPTDFGGHPGLLLRYAERFARHGRPCWEPEGPAREYLELVRGVDVAER